MTACTHRVSGLQVEGPDLVAHSPIAKLNHVTYGVRQQGR